jgi:hypothetical protein
LKRNCPPAGAKRLAADPAKPWRPLKGPAHSSTGPPHRAVFDCCGARIGSLCERFSSVGTPRRETRTLELFKVSLLVLLESSASLLEIRLKFANQLAVLGSALLSFGNDMLQLLRSFGSRLLGRVRGGASLQECLLEPGLLDLMGPLKIDARLRGRRCGMRVLSEVVLGHAQLEFGGPPLP